MSIVSIRRAHVSRRRVAVLATVVACLGAGAVIVPATQADQSHPATVHAYIAHDGSTVVTGFDGGAPITGRAP